MKRALPLLTIFLCWGCHKEPMALVQVLNPLNGATNVKGTVKPLIRFRSLINLDAADRRIVLYDVTKGAKRTVGGSMFIEGSVLTYEPKAPFGAKKDYMLEVLEKAIIGDDYELTDGSEVPDESITWPYQYRFSTASAPRIRGIYLFMVDGTPHITIYFSQKMEPVATGQAIKLLDEVTHKELRLGAPLWLDENTVRIQPAAIEKMDSSQLYTIKVGGAARSADNTALDGDGDGTPGEKKDDFCTGFTTIQNVIFSRLGGKKPSSCP